MSNRMTSHRTVVAGLGLLAVLAAIPAYAQDYPSRPVRIVTGSPGGGTDLNSRLFADGLSKAFGQSFIVENRGGAVGPAAVVFRTPADGYTLALDGSSFWIGSLIEKLEYDPVRDYAPVSLVSIAPQVLSVHPTLPVNSVKELVALAKAKPGALNYSVGNAGSGPNLAGDLFRIMSGANIVRIPYKGGAGAVNALLAGEVQISFVSAGAIAPHIKSGKLKPLGVTSLKPSPLFPGLPTVAEGGMPGFEANTYFGMFVPAKTPATVISRLSAEMGRVAGNPEVKERLANAGITAVGSPPKDLDDQVKGDLVKWAKLAKD